MLSKLKYKLKNSIKKNEFYCIVYITSYYRTCQSDRTFDNEAPICELVSCGKHNDVTNGDVLPSDQVYYGSSVHVQCKPGYVLAPVVVR